MDRPRVVIHSLISLDGRLDGFPADAGLYYELVSRLPHQAVLTGSGTMLAAAASQGIDLSGEDAEPVTTPASAGDTRPLLVIVDSGGRLTRYAWLRGQPYWRDVLVLCSSATPAGQLDRLRRHHVGYHVLGDDRVDLASALTLLARRYHVDAVRVDAGAGLLGALLRARLADEMSVVIAPYLAASATASQLRLISGLDGPDPVALELTAVERLRQGHLWLRYDVRHALPKERRALYRTAVAHCLPRSETGIMRSESLGRSYLALPEGTGPFPGVVVVHEAFGLNDNIRDICGRFAAEGYAALGVDLFEGRSRAVCVARMFAGAMAGNLGHYGVPALKTALGQLASCPEVDAGRIGAAGFCLGGSVVLTWACTDDRLAAIAPFYGAAPRPREAIRRMCPVVGSWPGKDFTTKAAGVLETELTAAGIPHDLKVYPGAKHSFFNDRWRAYHPAAAADSWQRVLAFFAEHVRQRRP